MNHEHYADPTADKAIANVMKKEGEKRGSVRKFRAFDERATKRSRKKGWKSKR